MRRTSLVKPAKGESAGKFLRGKSLRKAVYERDHGVCARCDLDTAALEKEIQDLPVEESNRVRLRHRILKHEGLPTSGHLWHADHTKPVTEGGGEGGLENLRTLCHPCHKEVTRELRQRTSKGAQQREKLNWGRRKRDGDDGTP